MKIEEIEYTPNPNAVKFIVDEQLTLGGKTRSFETSESTQGVPLAADIMAIDHVSSVFFADRWLTVTQDGEEDWHGLMREVAEPLRAATLDDARPPDAGHGSADDAAAAPDALDQEEAGFQDPRMDAIRAVLNEQILPYLQGDGGGLQIKALIDDQLMIRYQGACGSCPASVSGTLMAIENLVKDQVDPGLSVVSV